MTDNKIHVEVHDQPEWNKLYGQSWGFTANAGRLPRIGEMLTRRDWHEENVSVVENINWIYRADEELGFYVDGIIMTTRIVSTKQYNRPFPQPTNDAEKVDILRKLGYEPGDAIPHSVADLLVDP